MRTVLFSAMRNEAPFILDWVAYHRAIGFEKICIVTNDCTDQSRALLNILQEAGIVDHFDQKVPAGLSPQRAATELVDQKAYLEQGDWAIFLDSDEYLNIKIGEGRVADLVDHLSDQKLSGMLINWRLFGDGANAQFPGSYVSTDYVHCQASTEVTQFKTLFQVGGIGAGFSGDLHRCRINAGKGKLTDFITGSGQTLDHAPDGRSMRRHRRWLAQGEETFGLVLGPEIGYDIAQINHYIVRDPKSFALKSSRGRGHKPQGRQNIRHTAKFYQENNHNDAEDRTILRWADQVQTLKGTWRAALPLNHVLDQIADDYAAQTGDALQAASGSNEAPRTFPLTFSDQVAAHVKAVYREAAAIVEYGSGGSTLLATNLGVPCVSVESDETWARDLRAALADVDSAGLASEINYIDIGPTKEWGYPVDNRKMREFWKYPMQVWSNPIAQDADTVLIDGRMRKACFAATLLKARRETRILFDDYANRRRYHDVEQFAQPVRRVGHMAEFHISPGQLGPSDFEAILPWFSDMN